MTMKNRTIALGIVSAFALAAAVPASAGPLMPNQAAVKAAAPDQATDVQWRGRGHHRGGGIGPGIAFGLAAGALAGAAIASQPYGYGYGPGYGYYEEPVYAAPYGYQPMYEAPVSGYSYGYSAPTYSYGPGYYRSGRCMTDEGYGRRAPC